MSAYTDTSPHRAEPTWRSRQWTVRYALVAYAATWVIVGAVSLGLWLPFGLRVPRGLGALSIDAAWLLSLIPLYRSSGLDAKDLGLRVPAGAESAGLAVLVLFAYGWFAGVWDRGLGVGHVASPFAGISHASVAVIVLTGIAALVSPVVEEIFFRGLLYRALRNRLPVLPASVLVGLMFAVIHTQYPVEVLAELVFLGVALCLLYEQTGSLLPGIAVDMYLDLGGFESGLTGNSHVVNVAFVALLAALLLGVYLRGSGGGSVDRAQVQPRSDTTST